MVEPERRRGRVHDAEGAQEAILRAAEEIFAEHGFDGARIDAIAAASGYNKSLIFHYFGDKLNLYAEVVKDADRQMSVLQAQLLGPLLEDEMIATDAYKFRALLQTIIRVVFDYLVEHPRFVRMLLWEMAEGWQTYARIMSRFNTEDNEPLEVLLQRAHRAGLLRSDFAPLLQLSMILQVCQSYLAYVPLYQTIRPREDYASSEALARAREYIVTFVVHGMMADIPETKPQKGG